MRDIGFLDIGFLDWDIEFLYLDVGFLGDDLGDADISYFPFADLDVDLPVHVEKSEGAQRTRLESIAMKHT